jgi:hypothetical protein
MYRTLIKRRLQGLCAAWELLCRRGTRHWSLSPDKEEVARVRTNFLKKKLGLTNPDAELDKAIMAIAEKMKGDRTKNRVTVYYLLADHFGGVG